jgi:hypothetical protein
VGQELIEMEVMSDHVHLLVGCDPQFGNGAALDNGLLVLSKIGRIAVRWSRPLEGTPKTVTISREADG